MWGKDKIQVSHLQFADDALILGEWSLSNSKNLSRILICFHLASGLKVNFNKSKLFGIGVSNIELSVVASSLGCLASEFPCSYLGLPIGAQMSRCANWNPLVDRFQKRLSKWKGSTLSIGGRLTLTKSVLGSLGVYYFSLFKAPKKVIYKLESIRRRFFWGGNSDQEKISWIAWKKVTLPRKSGGLGIGSLMDSNQSLLAKWWWRFRKEENTLWCKVIRSIHGSSGGIDSVGLSFSWAWRRAVRSQDELLELTDLQNLILNLHLSMEQDTWEFTPEPSRFFKVNTMRKIISNTSTDSTSQQTRWNKILPSKVNILAWRVLLHRLPTRVNLNHRGIDLDSLPNTSITNLDDMFSLPGRVTMESKLKPFSDVQVSETKETGLTSGEYTISLYEVLARVHGTKIVPQIDNIMSTIIKTLSTSVISFALHQACSKVVPAIARYGMDPTTPENKKRRIIYSLCKPLSDSLLSSQENLSSGAALCLKALVDSDNWRFASSELVNEVCQRVTVALEKPMQTNSHMGLVMSLAEHNSSIVEAYARLLIWSGIKILNIGASEGNSQKRLVAIQMVNFLMKCLDYKCILSELDFVIEEMKKCEDDQMAFVKGAAFEATQTAKRILMEKGSKVEQRSGQRMIHPYTNYDGIFFKWDVYTEKCPLKTVTYTGFLKIKKSRSYINLDNVKIFTTPSKLVKSLQSPNELYSDSEKQSQTFRSPVSSKYENGVSDVLNDRFAFEDEQYHRTTESVCSTEDIFEECMPEAKARRWFFALRILSGLAVLFGIIVCFLLVGGTDEDCNLVPT
ncbi:protein SINE1 isoform X2 [Tanacetum coccineum]|uniref:Protein SINE1 isoform X2 n=1 Tax=Tanacetum coccineum TaxID=301880 RepID=A0ABQ4Z701_9ASTR